MSDPLKVFVATALEILEFFTQVRPVLEASTKKRSVVLSENNLNMLQHDIVFLYKAALSPAHGPEWKEVVERTQREIKHIAVAIKQQTETLGIESTSRFVNQIDIRVKILKALRPRLGAKYHSETNPQAKRYAKTRNNNV